MRFMLPCACLHQVVPSLAHAAAAALQALGMWYERASLQLKAHGLQQTLCARTLSKRNRVLLAVRGADHRPGIASACRMAASHAQRRAGRPGVPAAVGARARLAARGRRCALVRARPRCAARRNPYSLARLHRHAFDDVVTGAKSCMTGAVKEGVRQAEVPTLRVRNPMAHAQAERMSRQRRMHPALACACCRPSLRGPALACGCSCRQAHQPALAHAAERTCQRKAEHRIELAFFR